MEGFAEKYMKMCPMCGIRYREEFETCPRCGSRLTIAQETRFPQSKS